MSGSETLALIAALASGVSGVGAALAAVIMIRLQRRWTSADAFLRISEVFESAAFRKYKTIIYRLDRSSYPSWTDEEMASVNAWCAYLDIVSVLIQSRQISKVAFLNLYGDVTLRTIYQIAPYCNHQLSIRGKQFLLPLRLLAGDLVRTWKRRAAKKRYPLLIGFPDQPRLRVSPDLFDSDEAVVAFRVDGAIR